MPRRRRVAVTVLAAFVVAEAAVLLLRPRNGVIAPAPVDLEGYFTPEELDRARSYRRGQLRLFAAGTAIEVGLLAALAQRPPAALRAPRRPVLAGAAAAVGLSLGSRVARLPVSALSHRRSVAVGLSTQSWGPWLGDVAKGSAVGSVFAAGGGAAVVALMRRRPQTWWVPGAAGAIGFAVVTLYLGPVVLDPIFNRFTPLADGETHDDVLALAREAGVDVGQVLEVDASRRTTASNAYVTGLGRTKRVVLFDNLLEDFTREEVRLVVAHELAHVRYRDVPRGLAFVALVAPVSMLAAARMVESTEPGPAVLPALALALGAVGAGVSTIANQLSRRMEARADTYSLTLTDAPEPFIGFERGITIRNVADPDPPRWQVRLLATHPPTVDRIGIAERYAATGPEDRRTPGGS